MTTIKQETLGHIRVPIAGTETRISKFTLPPVAIPDLGRAAPALMPERLARNSGLTRNLTSGLKPSLTWARAAADALGVIGLPAAVLSGSHRLAAVNELLERLIPEVVHDRPSRLGLADRRADAMLGEALRRLYDSPGGGARAIPLAATRRLPASLVHVFPAHHGADAGAVSCVVVVTAIARPQIASAQVLQDLFGLTPAEARVARWIAAGKRIRDIADEAGLAAGTVRQQLKSVFAKTGVSRQADLVGLLVGSGLGLPAIMSIGDLA
jgi:DNA-binding CsgD family transcriptional regulator